ncbi:MAG: aspartate aminotransferase family protein, partial [Bacteroidota bacterium]
MDNKHDCFPEFLAHTSRYPLSVEISEAKGIYMYSPGGQQYIDLISGLSVNNIGHCHPSVVKAIKNQAEKHLHLMVYGEIIQYHQTQLAKNLSNLLPFPLQSTYIVNSGSEAIEGALKLAKRYTKRTEIIAFKNAYHGGTHGALSLMGDEYYKNSYRPLLPGIRFLTFNNLSDLRQITRQTACVVVEPIQAEAGIMLPVNDFLHALAERCKQTGTLLVLDEVQTGMKRTGPLFAFMDYTIIPDILVAGKALGGGMPVGAFIASKEIMDSLQTNPVLGHITTFGGHPLVCAAANAALEVITGIDSNHIIELGVLFKTRLNHPKIKEVRGKGLFMAVELNNSLNVKKFLQKAL